MNVASFLCFPRFAIFPSEEKPAISNKIAMAVIPVLILGVPLAIYTTRKYVFARAENEAENIKKMWKNSLKAILEHNAKKNSYVCLKDGLPAIEELETPQAKPLLDLKWSYAEEQGERFQMEDAHFFKETLDESLLGVFDGHGGSDVADYVNEQFPKRFFDLLIKLNRNVRRTFEQLIDELHKEVEKNPVWNGSGTTAVICFIDKKTSFIYTATLGDSEANIYRRLNEDELVSIPLSCVRDWSSQKDAERASIALNNPEIKESWPKVSNSKRLRYGGINVSRAIGDFHLTGTREKPGVIHKPKITLNLMKPGDILILGCDGLKDYVPEHEIIAILKENSADQAKKLVKHALNVKHSKDNVTVLIVNVN